MNEQREDDGQEDEQFKGLKVGHAVAAQVVANHVARSPQEVAQGAQYAVVARFVEAHHVQQFHHKGAQRKLAGALLHAALRAEVARVAGLAVGAGVLLGRGFQFVVGLLLPCIQPA